jgi:diaminohydroxyphosphoribosylaminopyrimidine deaminase / 5-amino-6-(5-phosphoribosylamino)uracil reductase
MQNLVSNSFFQYEFISYFCNEKMEENQLKYMQRCLQLAKLGEGNTAPNPMVGCVIVNKDKIIGEGFHQRYGGKHAEVNAINSVKDTHLLQHSTLYVNLEPCSHYGKTPPCSDLIIEKKIPRLVIGTIDPNTEVAGKGIEKLKNIGCIVDIGIMENECLELNRRFFTFHNKKRPYIILKWAQTSNGYVDTIRSESEQGKATWITDEIARISVHKQRSTEGAIFIGTETALKDNPSLTLRDWYGQQPLRISTDLNNKLPSDLTLFDGTAKTAIISKADHQSEKQSILVLTDITNNVVQTLLDFLFHEKILSVIIEGGPKTLKNFIDINLWDEAHIFTGHLDFEKGVKAPDFNWKHITSSEVFPQSKLSIFRNYWE